MTVLNQILDFFTSLFVNIISGFDFWGISPFFFLVACVVVSCIFSVVFHNKS